MKRSNSVIAIWGVVLSSSAIAGTIGAVQPESWRPVVALSAGPTWAQPGETQTFFLQPGIEKTYQALGKVSTFVSGEFFLGGQKFFNRNWASQLGIAIAGAGNTQLTGNVWEDADPNFNNFTYSYKINQVRVAVKGRLFGLMYFGVQPYVSGSVGVGFNRAYDVTINPKIFAEIAPPKFTPNTETSFSYTVGIGLQKTWSENWQLGIGYEFADWGNSHLGRASGQTLNQGLSLNHLYAHQLQFTVSYVV